MAFDIAIVGAGIIGLAHGYAAARRGLRVVIVDRDAQANSASIRNFGLVVVSGQEPGRARTHAERTKEIWLELAAQAGIDVLQRGKVVAAQRPEAMSVLEAFKSTEHGRECRLLTAAETAKRAPGLSAASVVGGMYSPYELRVESRHAVPRISDLLAERYRVTFQRGVAVTGVSPGVLSTSAGELRADRIVVCPGDDLATLFPDRIASQQVRRCKLQMLRLSDPGFRLPSAMVSDLSLLRYEGYSMLLEAQALRARLEQDCPAALANGVHLIVTQSSDGSLVVGDSHHYGHTPDPFGSEEVDALILNEFAALFGRVPDVTARWIGTYASAPDHAYFTDAPHPNIRLVMITSGTGASTGFSIGEETISDLLSA